MNADMDKVVVITINYNQNECTFDCISSLLESDYHDFNVVLIDNGPEPEHHTELIKWMDKKNDARLILKRLKKNLGYSGGINYGLQFSTELNPDYLMFMNNDAIIDNNSISELVRTCKKFNNKAIVSGKVYWYDKQDIIQNTGTVFKRLNKSPKPIGLNKKDIGQYDREAERDMLDDVFWLFPFTLYKEIGDYSKYYWFNYQQADFVMRAKKKDYKLIYTPKAKIWHKSGASIGGKINNPEKEYYSTQGSLIFTYLHFPLYDFIIHYLRVLSRFILAIIRYFMGKNSFKYALAKILGVIYFHRWLFKRNENSGNIPSIIKQN